jgi:hypothetical protein
MSTNNGWIVTADSTDGAVFTPSCPVALTALIEFDRSMLGTAGYLGFCFFWSYEYRHHLRDASYYRRRLVHKKFCEAGLSLNTASDQHLQIILQVVYGGQ